MAYYRSKEKGIRRDIEERRYAVCHNCGTEKRFAVEYRDISGTGCNAYEDILWILPDGWEDLSDFGEYFGGMYLCPRCKLAVRITNKLKFGDEILDYPKRESIRYTQRIIDERKKELREWWKEMQ